MIWRMKTQRSGVSDLKEQTVSKHVWCIVWVGRKLDWLGGLAWRGGAVHFHYGYSSQDIHSLSIPTLGSQCLFSPSRFKDNHRTLTCHKLTCKRHLLCLFNRCLCAHVCMTLFISSKFLKFKPEHSHNHPDFEEAVSCRTSLSPRLPLGSPIVTPLFIGTKLEASLTVHRIPQYLSLI